MQEHGWPAFAFEADVTSLKQSSYQPQPFIKHATVTLLQLGPL